MRTPLFLVSLLAAASACSSDDPEIVEPIVEEHFAATRSYQRALFATEAECAAAQAEGVNCFQQVDFCADGSAFVMWTDIVGSGSYTIRDTAEVIDTEWQGSDGPAVLQFELAADLLTVRDGWQGATFVYEEGTQDFGCE